MELWVFRRCGEGGRGAIGAADEDVVRVTQGERCECHLVGSAAWSMGLVSGVLSCLGKAAVKGRCSDVGDDELSIFLFIEARLRHDL